MNYIWFGIMILALVAEALTVQMVAIWFAPSALLALIANLLGAPLWLQITVFILFSAFCVTVLYGKLRKNISNTCEKTNIDAIIGAEAVVEEDIDEGGYGRVKIKGVSWKAQSEVPVSSGEKVKIASIDGVTLKCEPVKEKELTNIK